MPSPPSTRPSDARGRRSSAFVRERHLAAMETSAVSSSNRQSNVAFEHRRLQLRALSALPQCGSVRYPIPHGPSVRSFAARNRAWDADKLGAHLSGRQLDLRITMPSKVHELEVRSEIGVG